MQRLVKRLPILLAIAATELLSYGYFINHRGFYADDWIFLYQSFSAGGLWRAMALRASQGGWSRPLEILHYPIFYSLFGLHPFLYQLLLILLKIAEGWLLFMLWERLFGRRGLAAAAACLALAIPVRLSTHLWYANSPQQLSIVLLLASLLAHASWIRSRKPPLLLASLSLYLLSVLSYESTSFMPLILGAALAANSIKSGKRFGRAIAQALRELSPYGYVFIVALLWARVGSKVLLGTPTLNPVDISPGRFVLVFARGLSCLTLDCIRLCLHALPLAAHYLTPWIIAIVVIASLALGFTWRTDPEKDPPGISSVAAVSAVAFMAAYLPYAFSQHLYLPQLNGIMDRVNGLGAWSSSLFWAAGISALAKRHRLLARASFGLLLAIFGLTNVFTCLQWAVAWETAHGALARAAEKAAPLPPSSTVILAGVPVKIGGAPVFSEGWDFEDALRIASGRTDLRGKVADRLRFDKDYFAEQPSAAYWPRTEEWRFPYKDVFIFDASKDSFYPLFGPPKAPL